MKHDILHRILFFAALIITAGLFGNQIFPYIPIRADSVFILFYVFLMGLLLLPMAKKLKIANMFEFERMERKIEEIETVQYLGEVLEWNKNLFYFTKNEKGGKTLYQIPDKATAEFLMTNKGLISVNKKTLKSLREYNDPANFSIDSVRELKNIRKYQSDHFYAILSGKKYWMSATQLLEHLPKEEQRNEVVEMDECEFKKTPTGR